MEMDEKYIKSKIKGREVVYYLTTEEDLNDIKSKSIFGDVFILFFSLSMGGIISIIITKGISSLSNEQARIADILNNVFIVSSLIFGCFAIYFYIASFKAIKKIKGSGEIKSFAAPETSKANGLEIIEANYWTKKASKDVTKKVSEKIVDDKLFLIVDNEIDGDPDPGNQKKMTLKYRKDGVVFMKEYTENNKIELP